MKKLAAALLAALLYLPQAFAANQAPLQTPTTGPMSATTWTSTYLNPALIALGTCNWGSSAPANGIGLAANFGQCWIDTSATPANIMKLYDGASWLTIGTFNSSTHVWAAAGSTASSPQGRLSLESGVPVTGADMVGYSTVYVVGMGSLATSIYDGTSIVARTFTDNSTIILDSTGHVASTNYDIFECWNGTAVVYGTGPAWTSDIARGTGASTTEVDTTIGGRWTNAVSLVIRNNSVNSSAFAAHQCNLRGSFRTTLAGVTEDSLRKRFLSNVYNAVPRGMKIVDATTSWVYSTATLRQMNNNVANQLDWLHTVAGRSVDGRLDITVINSTSTTRSLQVNLGLDGINQAQCVGDGDGVINAFKSMKAFCMMYVGIGRHYSPGVEYGGGADVQTWYSVNGILFQIQGQTVN